MKTPKILFAILLTTTTATNAFAFTVSPDADSTFTGTLTTACTVTRVSSPDHDRNPGYEADVNVDYVPSQGGTDRQPAGTTENKK